MYADDEWILLLYRPSRPNEDIHTPLLRYDWDPNHPTLRIEHGFDVEAVKIDGTESIDYENVIGTHIIRFRERMPDHPESDIDYRNIPSHWDRLDYMARIMCDMIAPYLRRELERMPMAWNETEWSDRDLATERSRLARTETTWNMLASSDSDAKVPEDIRSLRHLLDALEECGLPGRYDADRRLERIGLVVSFATLAQLVWQICHDLGMPSLMILMLLVFCGIICLLMMAFERIHHRTP